MVKMLEQGYTWCEN